MVAFILIHTSLVQLVSPDLHPQRSVTRCPTHAAVWWRRRPEREQETVVPVRQPQEPHVHLVATTRGGAWRPTQAAGTRSFSPFPPSTEGGPAETQKLCCPPEGFREAMWKQRPTQPLPARELSVEVCWGARTPTHVQIARRFLPPLQRHRVEPGLPPPEVRRHSTPLPPPSSDGVS